MKECYRNWTLASRTEALTIKSPTTEIINTVAGPARYGDWCIAECKRINKANPRRKAKVVTDTKKATGRNGCYIVTHPYNEVELGKDGKMLTPKKG